MNFPPNDAGPAPAVPPPGPTQTLDQLLIAIQKSFSRVSASANELPVDAARSLIVGQVAFNIQLRGNLVYDQVVIDPAGVVTMQFSGNIDQDVREVAATTPQTSPSQEG